MKKTTLRSSITRQSRVRPLTSPRTDRSGRRPQSRPTRYVKYGISVLATFGVLGAVGIRVVDSVYSDATEKIRGGGPLSIGVRLDPHGGLDGFLAAARSAKGLDKQFRTVNSCQSLFEAARKAAAVAVGESTTHFILEGRTHRDVAIVDMRAKILKREPVLRGAAVSCESAGDVGAIGVVFNLDEPDPVARRVLTDEQRMKMLEEGNDDPGDLGGPYFARGNIVRLTKSEIQPVEVVARTTRNYIEWEIEADVIVDGDERTVVINNHGDPFRITGGLNKFGDYGRFYEWRWYRQPQDLYIGTEPSRVE